MLRLLHSIYPQMNDQVDVFVSVNQSKLEYPIPDWVQHRTTHINVGGNPNIGVGPLLVTGDYIWVIGDDDQLLPDAIPTTLTALENNPGLIVHLDEKYPHGLQWGTTFGSYTQFCEALLDYGNPSLLLAHTLISSNTFVRAAYDVELAYKKIDTMYGFHYGMLNNLIDQPVTILPKPTMLYGNQPSLHQHPKDLVVQYMKISSTVLFEMLDWLSERTGLNIPHSVWTKGFV